MDSTTFPLHYGLFPHFGALYSPFLFKLHYNWHKNAAVFLIVIVWISTIKFSWKEEYKFVQQRENENSATKMLCNAAKNRITASWKCKRLRIKTGNRDFWRCLSRAREISQWGEWSTIMNAQVKDNKLRSKKCVPCKRCSDWGWLSGYFKAIHRFCNRQQNAILRK